MSDTMRWRYGDTNPVLLAVGSATVIEIGDLVYLDTDDAKPASAHTDQESESANQEEFSSKFAGVAKKLHHCNSPRLPFTDLAIVYH